MDNGREPEVSSPVWVCAVTLLQYIGKEKCEHSLRSEDDSAEHVLLDGLARRRLCVWCRPRHEVVGTFKCFQRIGAQKRRLYGSGRIGRRSVSMANWTGERATNKRSSTAGARTGGVGSSELLGTGTQHLNWSGHLLKQDWTVRKRGVPESFTQGWVKTKDKHPKRYHLILETLSASSIPSSFPEALDTCFGGELLRYANLTPTLELDAERNDLRENPQRRLSKQPG